MAGRVVLIGGSGFVGSHLRVHLGEGNLVCPSRQEADLTDRETLYRTIQKGDCVINAAGYASVTDATEAGRSRFRALNVRGVENLARAASERGASQLIHLSSVAAMGRWFGSDSVTEDMIRPDSTPYALSKREGEQVLGRFGASLPITILRPTSVFGEGRGLAQMLCHVITRGCIPLPCGGRAKVPFTYVGNLAHAVRLSIRNPRCYGRTFIVGDETSYPLREVVKAFSCAMGVPPRIVSIPRGWARAGAWSVEILAGMRGTPPVLNRWRLDNMLHSIGYSIAAFKDATGYVPPYDLATAAARIAAWYTSSQA